MQYEQVHYLFDQYFSGRSDPAEQAAFFQLLQEGQDDAVLGEAIGDAWQRYAPNENMPVSVHRDISSKLFTDGNIQSPVHRVQFLRRAWFRYAAILLLIAGVATFGYINNGSRKNFVLAKANTKPGPDIMPGSNRALLTLSDGTIIALDSAANGSLAQQGNTKILKPDAGSLKYEAGNASGELLYNTISTPKGGQYQVVLPDGSRIWLNAASSVKFPASFSASRRMVEITGEAYLEVVSNSRQPFVVKTNGMEVQVLGTSFNINAYADEPATKTTLLEGSVKINKDGASRLLAPGEQAIVKEAIQVNDKINLRQVMAWKNGIFDFQDKKLEEVMRQLARWYNIEIIYAKGIPNVEFYGKMGRNLKLSDVLEFLKESKIHIKLEGRTLTILP